MRDTVSGGVLCTSRRGFYMEEEEEETFLSSVSPGFVVSDSLAEVLFECARMDGKVSRLIV